MSRFAFSLAAAGCPPLAAAPLLAKAAFVGVFVLLLAWLLFLPPQLLDDQARHNPWWRNVRFWAVVVTLAQIWVYAYWG